MLSVANPSTDKVTLEFRHICERLKQVDLPEVDWVVGIATGGGVPASLIAYQLDKPLGMIHIHFRSADNTPESTAPVLIGSQNIPQTTCRVLLVDDVSVTGQTFAAAKRLLTEHDVSTFVLKGQADYVLFPEIETCVQWPWKL